MTELLESDATLQVGEIGLDKSLKEDIAWEEQKRCFRSQLSLCARLER